MRSVPSLLCIIPACRCSKQEGEGRVQGPGQRAGTQTGVRSPPVANVTHGKEWIRELCARVAARLQEAILDVALVVYYV
jgi:hypothetical protein